MPADLTPDTEATMTTTEPLYLRRCIQWGAHEWDPLWWRPDGYTDDPTKAGQYTRDPHMPEVEAEPFVPAGRLREAHDTHSVQVDAVAVLSAHLNGVTVLYGDANKALDRACGSEICGQCGARGPEEAEEKCRPQEDETGERWCAAEEEGLWRGADGEHAPAELTTTEPLDLDRLRAAAQGVIDEEARPGDADWHLDSDDDMDTHNIVYDCQGHRARVSHGTVAHCSVASDAQHIAAFRPRVALALVDEIATLRAEVATLTADCVTLQGDKALLSAEVARLTLERDEANAWNQRCRDMVHRCRGRLFMDGVLDEVEYVALCSDHGAAGRLEDYSDIRRERDEARQAASVEAKLGDEARAEVARLEAAAACDRRQFARLSEEKQQALVEVERLRADLAAIWTICTGIVSTAADGPGADNIPRRVEELRALALQPMDGPPTEPGWYVAKKGRWRVAMQVRTTRGAGVFVVNPSYAPGPGGDDRLTLALEDACVEGWRLLARIPVEAVEVSDGE